MKNSVFGSYHPVVNFIYFTFILVFSMVFMNPVCLLSSLFCSFVFYRLIYPEIPLKKTLGLIFSAVFFLSVTNSLFSHNGVTILFYLPSGNPLTLESLLYGFFSGVMLSAVILWFMCLSKVISSEKIIWLFSRFSPSVSLLITMILSFIPKFTGHYKNIRDAELISPGEGKNIKDKIKIAYSCFVSTVSFCLENAIETSDSMKSRGYGSGKRTFYSNYRFRDRDKICLLFIITASFFILCGAFSGQFYFRFYPDIQIKSHEPITVTLYISYFLSGLMPIYLEVKERAKWKHSESKT